MAGKSNIDQLEQIKKQVVEISTAITQGAADIIKRASELRQNATMLNAGKIKVEEGKKILDVTSKELKNCLVNNEENKSNNKLKSKDDVQEIEQQQQSNIRPKLK